MAKMPSAVPAMIVQLLSEPSVSTSVATEVPTAVAIVANSDTLNVWPGGTTGALSFRSFTVIVKL